MQKRRPTPAKRPPPPNVGSEPITPPDMLDPEQPKPRNEARPGVTEGRHTAAERAGSLEKAPGEPGKPQDEE